MEYVVRALLFEQVMLYFWPYKLWPNLLWFIRTSKAPTKWFIGSDVHWWAGDFPTPGNGEPFVIGHEASGIVLEVGPGTC